MPIYTIDMIYYVLLIYNDVYVTMWNSFRNIHNNNFNRKLILFYFDAISIHWNNIFLSYIKNNTQHDKTLRYLSINRYSFDYFLCMYNVHIVYTTDVMKFNFGFQFHRCRRSQVPSVSHLCSEKIVLFLNFAKNNLLQNINIFFP